MNIASPTDSKKAAIRGKVAAKREIQKPSSDKVPEQLNGNGKKTWREKLNGKAWGISLAISVVGTVLVYWGFQNTQIHPADMSTWSREHWLPVLLIWGTFAALIALNMSGAAAKTLQWMLAVVAFVLFIGFPVWVWATGPSTAPVLSMAPGGKSELVAVPSGMRVVMHGEDIRYHCMYQDGHEESFVKGEPACKDGHVPFVYATNLRTDKGNAVTYSYKKK